MTFRATRADPASVIHVACNMRECDRQEIFATRWSDDPLSLVESTLFTAGITFVGWHNDEPTAVYGAKPFWPNVWTVFCYATDNFNKISIGLTRHCRNAIIPWLRVNGAHRAQAQSIATHVEAHRWLKLIGGYEESRLPRYGKNGEDFIMFAWSPESCRAWAAGRVRGC